MKIRDFGMTLTFLSLANCARTSPEAVAERFFRLGYAGDLIPAYAMLATRDQAAVPREEFIRNGEEGFPGAVVDSVIRKHGERGDTAIVYIYGRAPNRAQALSRLMQDGVALTDTAQLRDKVNRNSRSLPLITTVDSLTLVREKSGWRIWLGLAEQKRFAAIAEQVNDTYLKQSLSERRAMTREFFELAAKTPRFVPNYMKRRMENVVEAANCADRLRFSLSVDRGFVTFVRGTLFNGCDRDIKEVQFHITDATGETGYVTQDGIPAGRTVRVLEETHIAEGPVSRIDVLGIDFFGEEN
jgi:hypothetical protein